MQYTSKSLGPLERELKILKDLHAKADCKHVIHLAGDILVDSKEMCMVSVELCELGSLAELLFKNQGHRKLSPPISVSCSLCFKLLVGCKRSTLKVAHRDIEA